MFGTRMQDMKDATNILKL